MAERIVINTGPLIALARADLLEVAGSLPNQFICPIEVRHELDKGEARGYLQVNPTWLTVIPCTVPLHPVAVAALDPGRPQ